MLSQGGAAPPALLNIACQATGLCVLRYMQLDRMHAIPLGLKPLWDKDFLALLYDTITQKTEDEFGNEVFNRVERTFCCGLQSTDPSIRRKVRMETGYDTIYASPHQAEKLPLASCPLAVLPTLCGPCPGKSFRQAALHHPGTTSPSAILSDSMGTVSQCTHLHNVASPAGPGLGFCGAHILAEARRCAVI